MCAPGQCVCQEESGSLEAIWQSDSRLSSGKMVRICAGDRLSAGRIESDVGGHGEQKFFVMFVFPLLA